MSKHKPKSNADQGSKKGALIALGVGAAALIGLFAFAVYQSSQVPAKEVPTPASAKKIEIPGLEKVPARADATTHLKAGQTATYDTDPPLSGPHADQTVNPGFYSAANPKDKLVHSLEHGHVILYYNKAKLAEAEMKAVQDISAKFRGAWDGAIAEPREDAKYALVLTAWEHALRLEKYDQKLVDQFVDTFRGRGPENPVR